MVGAPFRYLAGPPVSRPPAGVRGGQPTGDAAGDLALPEHRLSSLATSVASFAGSVAGGAPGPVVPGPPAGLPVAGELLTGGEEGDLQ